MHVNRRQFIGVSSAAFTVLPLRRLFALQAQTRPQTGVEMRFETIRRSVGYFVGRGGTIGWMVNPDAVVVVDTQFPDTAKICVDGLAQKSSRGIDVVFNTHHHGDHTSGNPVFREKAKRIVAHSNVPALQKKAAPAQQGGTATPQVVADATFDETWSESYGDERVTARHYGPGHTGGDAIIQFERAEVVHMGDLLFHERHPFIDRPSGASIQNWITTLETVAKGMPGNTVYIAGHSKDGQPVALERKALQQFGDYLDAVLSHARNGIAAGASKEEITKLEVLKGFEGYQANPPRLSLAGALGVAYDELTEKS